MPWTRGTPRSSAEMLKNAISRAVDRLRNSDPDTAAADAYRFAKDLLNASAAETAAAQVQIWILALGLYVAAVANRSQNMGFTTLQILIEERYRNLTSLAPDDEFFAPPVEWPPTLEGYVYALSMLPREVVTAACVSLRTFLADAQ